MSACSRCDYACSDPSALKTHLKMHSEQSPANATNTITGQYGGKLRSEISPWCGVVLNWYWNWVLDLVVKLVVKLVYDRHFSRMIPNSDKGATSYVPVQLLISIQGYPSWGVKINILAKLRANPIHNSNSGYPHQKTILIDIYTI